MASIVDSHIHLFPASHLSTLAWHGPANPLGAQHSVDEYRIASNSASSEANAQHPGDVRGFIFLETDRISSVDKDGGGWIHALDEVSLLTRIALGEPLPGEGHTERDSALCLAIIPWAPVPGGPQVLEQYLAQVKERTRTPGVWAKIRGVRFLVQDKPAGTMLQNDFQEGIRWLGRQGLTFDLGVDARSGGLWQLREAVQMMEGVGETTIIISKTFKQPISFLFLFLLSKL
ncbi:hypothetical protein ASPZODRAFT_1242070 [Penicilliopsis zonata CBS 506.65]|uniref:Amidohydrolase-related domain-containing protein n=1 Tax=Penicilliopsis zonata CBS 506.65 TaxID=1073090 RepID=A0A1L9S700_9EURO|nr:hypothetical protein ASPZODRAFT_1242070 [Penicilliopsis zonata CBS 506.65]OJJ42937.1 hypothetical protein ASPZODRAFT_1242070 [Penicilliopsis zonata CBS 506.65]